MTHTIYVQYTFSYLGQAGMSRVLFLMESLYISIDLILPAALWSFGSTQPLKNEYRGSTWGFKGGRPARKADNLTAICEPIV
jgi:hypothetical protein